MGLFKTAKDTAGAGSTDGLTGLSDDAAILNASGAEMRRLWAEGVPGSAVIKATRDTGRRLAGNAVVELELEVTLDSGTTYPTTLRMPIGGSDIRPYGPGARYNVKVDPVDHGKLAFSA